MEFRTPSVEMLLVEDGPFELHAYLWNEEITALHLRCKRKSSIFSICLTVLPVVLSLILHSHLMPMASLPLIFILLFFWHRKRNSSEEKIIVLRNKGIQMEDEMIPISSIVGVPCIAEVISCLSIRYALVLGTRPFILPSPLLFLNPAEEPPPSFSPDCSTELFGRLKPPFKILLEARKCISKALRPDNL